MPTFEILDGVCGCFLKFLFFHFWPLALGRVGGNQDNLHRKKGAFLFGIEGDIENG